MTSPLNGLADLCGTDFASLYQTGSASPAGTDFASLYQTGFASPAGTNFADLRQTGSASSREGSGRNPYGSAEIKSSEVGRSTADPRFLS